MLAKAPTLTIILPVLDADGVMRFPNSGGPYFGIHCAIDQSAALSRQAIAAVSAFLKQGDLTDRLEPVTTIEPILRGEGKDPSLLYLMRVTDPTLKADSRWLTLMQVLRSLPAGSNRVAYNKVLQYLAGAATAEVSVLEMDEEVKKRIQHLMSENPENLVD